MAQYDTFIATDFKDLQEDVETVGVIRDVEPGRKKYRSTYARYLVSKDAAKYPDILWIRLGRGQLIDTPCSAKILELINVIPQGM